MTNFVWLDSFNFYIENFVMFEDHGIDVEYFSFGLGRTNKLSTHPDELMLFPNPANFAFTYSTIHLF